MIEEQVIGMMMKGVETKVELDTSSSCVGNHDDGHGVANVGDVGNGHGHGHGDDDDGQIVVGNGGQEFMEYCVYGKPFQVLAKYKPPFNPIGQGAYGFVW